MSFLKRSKAALVLGIWAAAASAEQPLSAIDWLNQPVPAPAPASPLAPVSETVTDNATSPTVTVTPLDAPRRDAVGLLPAARTGLPASIWQASATTDLTRMLQDLDSGHIPALQSLVLTLLLAEAEAPADTGGESAFLQARIRKLADMGAVAPALALLERAGPETPGLFRLWFDLTLLAGEEHQACAVLERDATLAPNYASRIYCSAQAGDWATAALTYETAQALDLLTAAEARLLAIYLDPDMIDAAPGLPPTAAPSPLEFRLAEAAGSPLPTARLPLAYAVADLRDTAGWKAQIEAAETLTRAGALSENRLLRLYTERRAAASGGVWDRVTAIHRLDTALTERDMDAVAARLPVAWNAMARARLEVPFAGMFADRLNGLTLPDAVSELQARIAFLGPDYETASSTGTLAPALTGIARGTPDPNQANTDLGRAILRAWTDPTPSARHDALMADGKLGAAILVAIDQLAGGVPGNSTDISEALSALRHVGLEDTARRAALQIMLLDGLG